MYIQILGGAAPGVILTNPEMVQSTAWSHQKKAASQTEKGPCGMAPQGPGAGVRGLLQPRGLAAAASAVMLSTRRTVAAGVRM
jgi:hypothetical protein